MVSQDCLTYTLDQLLRRPHHSFRVINDTLLDTSEVPLEYWKLLTPRGTFERPKISIGYGEQLALFLVEYVAIALKGFCNSVELNTAYFQTVQHQLVESDHSHNFPLGCHIYVIKILVQFPVSYPFGILTGT